MKALTWQGINKLSVERVPDPQIRNDRDVIVKVTRSVGCGSLPSQPRSTRLLTAADIVGWEQRSSASGAVER